MLTTRETIRIKSISFLHRGARFNNEELRKLKNSIVFPVVAWYHTEKDAFLEVVCKAPVAPEHALNHARCSSEDQSLQLRSNAGEFATQVALVVRTEWSMARKKLSQYFANHNKAYKKVETCGERQTAYGYYEMETCFNT